MTKFKRFFAKTQLQIRAKKSSSKTVAISLKDSFFKEHHSSKDIFNCFSTESVETKSA